MATLFENKNTVSHYRYQFNY